VRDVITAADNLKRARRRVEAADQALREAVTQARRDGASWADVGAVLGITRQSAQQRFGRARVPLTDPAPPPEPAPPPALPAVSSLSRQQRRALERRRTRKA
jgi:hypothetical protein